MAERNQVKLRTCDHCKKSFHFTAQEIKDHAVKCKKEEQK